MRSSYLVLQVGLSFVVGCGAALGGCTLDDRGLVDPRADGSGTGGLFGSGGAIASGGRTGSGGAIGGTGGLLGGTGGLFATGGRFGTGGHTTGGATSSGGRFGTGGAAETGGRGTGGRTASGGTGGLAATGGGAMETGGQAGGAPGGCGPFTCPNGCCDGNSCITNRGRLRCGNGGAACAPCADCFQCSDTGTCDVTPNSRWGVTCRSATLSATKPGGAQWDSGNGSEPDPVCEFQIDDVGQRDTDVLTDTFTPEWNESITPRGIDVTANWLVSRAGSWSILVADHDGMDNEEICQVFPTLTQANFSTGTVQFTNRRGCNSLTVQLVCED